MKKILRNKLTSLILSIISLAFLIFYLVMLIRPISYGMEYQITYELNNEEYQTSVFFSKDNKISIIDNKTNVTTEAYYYVTKGYLFRCNAQNEEQYYQEVEYINNNFTEAVLTPLYPTRINAFNWSYGNDYDFTKVVYTCNDLISFSIFAGIFELLLIAITATCYIFSRNHLH